MKHTNDRLITDLEKVLKDVYGVLKLTQEEAVIRGRRDWWWAVVRTAATSVAAMVVVWRVL